MKRACICDEVGHLLLMKWVTCCCSLFPPSSTFRVDEF